MLREGTQGTGDRSEKSSQIDKDDYAVRALPAAINGEFQLLGNCLKLLRRLLSS
jgi:hypothetical protein